VPGQGTSDAIVIILQLQEKHIAANKPLYPTFVNLEKAFNRVPRKFLWWGLRSLGMEEWAVRVIQGIYSNESSVCQWFKVYYYDEFAVFIICLMPMFPTVGANSILEVQTFLPFKFKVTRVFMDFEKLQAVKLVVWTY